MGSTTPPKDPDGAAFGFKDVVDFNGDVILQVGQEGHGKSLQVSSKVLNLASPVFAAMLNSTFVEGTVPADGQPRIISLPEDDGEAVTTLCLILHLQSHRVHMREFDHFERLAIVCDKYDCARALRPWSTLWLQKWCGSPSGEDDYWRMLYISYAYDDRAAFFVASRAILKHYTEDVMAFAYDIRPELAILPEGILSGLQERRRSIVETIHQRIEDVIKPCMEDARSKVSLYPTSENCCSTAKTGSYFLELSRLSLWPISESLRQCSVEQVLDKLSSWQDPSNIDYGLTSYHNNYYGRHIHTPCSCSTCSTSFRDLLQNVVDEQRKALGGLCLRCVQAGKTSVAKGNCQTEGWCNAIFELTI